MRLRIVEELALLRRFYEVEHKQKDQHDWFRIAVYSFPNGWRIGSEPISVSPIIFPLNASYPGGQPYGFLAPAGINFNGTPPRDVGSPKTPPFEGAWQHFSWQPESWQPSATVEAGPNLLNWVRSFRDRLEEGA